MEFMNCNIMIFIAISALFTVISQGEPSLVTRIPDEQRLYNQIMDNYLKTVRPMVNESTPLQVLFSMRLNQIVNLDERQQVLTTNVFIDQTWTDPALAWDPAEFKDVRSLRIPADQVWKPDTFIYNNADNGSTGFIHGTYIQIRHTGGVTWPVPVRLRSSCIVKIAYFPFDYQFCMVRFGSWIYGHTLVDYNVRQDVVSVDLSTYIKNSEWELMSMKLEKSVANRSRGLGSHPHLTAILYLKRNTFYYLFNIIVPCVMLSMLTLMTFWLSPTSGEKVTLGLSVFLAFSMFMLLIAEEVPASSDAVPLIGIYLCVVMTMTSLSVICAVLVTNLHNRGSKLKPAPRWLASLCIRYLAIPFHVNRDVQLLANTIHLSDYCQFFILHDNRCERIKLYNATRTENCSNIAAGDYTENCEQEPPSTRNYRLLPTSSHQRNTHSVQHFNKSSTFHSHHNYQKFYPHDQSVLQEQNEDEQNIELSDQKMDSPLLQKYQPTGSSGPLTPYKTVCVHDEITHAPDCTSFCKQQETSVDAVTSSCPELDRHILLAAPKRLTTGLSSITEASSSTTEQLATLPRISKPQGQILNEVKFSASGGTSDKFHDHYCITPCLTHETFCECGSSAENIWVLRDEPTSLSTLQNMQYKCACHTQDGDQGDVLQVVIPRKSGDSTSEKGSQLPSPTRRRRQPRVRPRRRTDPSYENPKLVLKRAKVMIAEWCTIAKVVDRLLFTLSLLATIFTYVFILIIVPAEHTIRSENVTFANSINTGQYRWN